MFATKVSVSNPLLVPSKSEHFLEELVVLTSVRPFSKDFVSEQNAPKIRHDARKHLERNVRTKEIGVSHNYHSPDIRFENKNCHREHVKTSDNRDTREGREKSINRKQNGLKTFSVYDTENKVRREEFGSNRDTGSHKNSFLRKNNGRVPEWPNKMGRKCNYWIDRLGQEIKQRSSEGFPVDKSVHHKNSSLRNYDSGKDKAPRRIPRCRETKVEPSEVISSYSHSKKGHGGKQEGGNTFRSSLESLTGKMYPQQTLRRHCNLSRKEEPRNKRDINKTCTETSDAHSPHKPLQKHHRTERTGAPAYEVKESKRRSYYIVKEDLGDENGKITKDTSTYKGKNEPTLKESSSTSDSSDTLMSTRGKESGKRACYVIDKSSGKNGVRPFEQFSTYKRQNRPTREKDESSDSSKSHVAARKDMSDDDCRTNSNDSERTKFCILTTNSISDGDCTGFHSRTKTVKQEFVEGRSMPFCENRVGRAETRRFKRRSLAHTLDNKFSKILTIAKSTLVLLLLLIILLTGAGAYTFIACRRSRNSSYWEKLYSIFF